MSTNPASPHILCANPKAQYDAHAEGIRHAISSVLESGWYVLGNEVTSFEKEFAEFAGVSHCIGVANGTDALALALRACEISPGDEVITVSHSAVATVAAIEQIGAIPVLCDITPENRCLNPELLPTLISERTKAIIVVHIYGHPADMESICSFAKHNNLRVIEDCAQAHGAKIRGQTVGSFGDAGTFSFYPTKNLGAIGDGGCVVTSSQRVADNVRSIRQYGWEERYVSSIPGLNSRLDELQAAILRVKLPHLESENNRRNEIANMYDQALLGTSLGLPHRSDSISHAMHLYVVEHDKRDSLQSFLASRGIQAAIHYPLAIHQQPAYSTRQIRGADNLPQTERLYSRILSLPMFPQLSNEHVVQTANEVRIWLEDNS